jgi:hypothetical protein
VTATGKDVNQVVGQLETCEAEIIQWASRENLQFDTVKTEAALFPCRRFHNKHLRPKLTAKLQVGDGFIRFNQDTTRWMGE